MNLGGFSINKNTTIAFLIALVCMMISAFCYYYLQRNVFTLGIIVLGISISCHQAYKCLKLLKKSN